MSQTHILFCFCCIFSSIFVISLPYTLNYRKSMIKALFIVSVSGQPRFSKFYEYIVFLWINRLSSRRWRIERRLSEKSMKLL